MNDDLIAALELAADAIMGYDRTSVAERVKASCAIGAHIADLRAGNLVRREDVVAYGRTVAAYYRGRTEYCENCDSRDSAWAKKSALTWTDRAEVTERLMANIAEGKTDMPEFWTGYGEHMVNADAIAAGAHEGGGDE